MIDTRHSGSPGVAQIGGGAAADLSGVSRSCGVLVVDDDRAVAEQLSGGLAAIGYAVDVVHSAADALALLATRSDIAVVVSDIRMPGQDGVELAQEILGGRNDAEATEVVLITGHGTLETAAAAVRARVSDFLTKPFRLADVAAAVDRALARAQSRRAEAAARVMLGRQPAVEAAPEPGGAMASGPGTWRSRDLHAVSHALRTPLNTIAGSAHLLGVGSVGGRVVDEPLGMLRDGLAQAVQAVELVEELHLLADTRPSGPPGGTVMPAQLVADALARARDAAGRAGVALQAGAQDAASVAGVAQRAARVLDLCLGALLETARPGCSIEVTGARNDGPDRDWTLLTLLLRPAGVAPPALPAGPELPDTSSPMARTQETLGFAVARRIAESLGGRLTSGNVGEGIVAIRIALPG
jgi:CheY-like chemotaxis protein